jgi:hypothetical protein
MTVPIKLMQSMGLNYGEAENSQKALIGPKRAENLCKRPNSKDKPRKLDRNSDNLKNIGMVR